MTLKTSANTPLRVDFVDTERLGITGRIGLTIAPGKKDRARQWDRDLDEDLARLRDHYAVDVLASLMEPHEYELLQIPELSERAHTLGISVRSFPIVDLGVPKPERMHELVLLVEALVCEAKAGKTIVIHCRGGLGRSGIVSACCLVRLGLDVSEAIAATREARPGAIETREQERWLSQFAGQKIESLVSNPPRADARVRTPLLSAFPGCLLGGALGDALGYPIEFWNTARIRKEHGAATPIRLGEPGMLALISDDTQMTLFTAEGMIRAWHRGMEKGICHAPTVIAFALLRWYETQGGRVERYYGDRGWLIDERRLRVARAPGTTCMSALASLAGRDGGVPTIDQPPNNSKGCGAVMRVAPCGLGADTREDAFALSRDTGVVTHGHPSGYLSAAYFGALIWDLARGSELLIAMEHADTLLARERGHDELSALLERARVQARRGTPSPSQIEELGGGWTGDEALAIALLCTLTCDRSAARPIEDALWRAAAHSGDSDSTAAITGNLLGASYGLSALPPSWLGQLELRDVIDRIASDLFATTIQHDTPPGYPGD